MVASGPLSEAKAVSSLHSQSRANMSSGLGRGTGDCGGMDTSVTES